MSGKGLKEVGEKMLPLFADYPRQRYRWRYSLQLFRQHIDTSPGAILPAHRTRFVAANLVNYGILDPSVPAQVLEQVSEAMEYLGLR